MRKAITALLIFVALVGCSPGEPLSGTAVQTPAPPNPAVQRAAVGVEYDDFVDDFASTNTNTYHDLSPDGPEVTVEIGPSGKALVWITTEMTVVTAGNGALMSYEVSGATNRAASDNWAVAYSPTDTGVVMFSRSSVQTGLTPGTHTFKAKYRSVTTGSSVAYQHREIIVFAL